MEFNDDGALMRGTFEQEKHEAFGDYAVFLATHRNDVKLDEPFEYEGPLERVQKYSAQQAPIKTVPPSGVDIVHFNPRELTASEYIEPHGWNPIRPQRNQIAVTNHGFGSGIYGIADPTDEQLLEAATKYRSKPYNVKLQNPLYLQDAEHGQRLTALSKELQRVAEAIRAEFPHLSRYGVKEWLEKVKPEALKELTALLQAVLVKVGKKDVASSIIADALFEFFSAYDTQDLVEQPINFLLQSLGYDGIYADNPSDNSFSRGSVSFRVPAGTPRTTRASRIEGAGEAEKEDKDKLPSSASSSSSLASSSSSSSSASSSSSGFGGNT